MAAKSERIERILSRVREPSVLNVGCVGEAETRFELHRELCESFPGACVRGIDTNREGVEQMRARGYDVLVGDAEALPSAGEFDTIVAGELIEHLANPGRFLAGCARTLRPGGRLVLSTPNPFSVMHSLMYLKSRGGAFNGGHACWFCPQTLRQIAALCGLRVVELSFVDDLLPERVESKWYRFFAYGWKLARRLLPRRLRNTLVAVLEPYEAHPDGPQRLPAAGR